MHQPLNKRFDFRINLPNKIWAYAKVPLQCRVQKMSKFHLIQFKLKINVRMQHDEIVVQELRAVLYAVLHNQSDVHAFTMKICILKQV